MHAEFLPSLLVLLYSAQKHTTNDTTIHHPTFPSDSPCARHCVQKQLNPPLLIICPRGRCRWSSCSDCIHCRCCNTCFRCHWSSSSYHSSWSLMSQGKKPKDKKRVVRLSFQSTMTKIEDCKQSQRHKSDRSSEREQRKDTYSGRSFRRRSLFHRECCSGSPGCWFRILWAWCLLN